MNKVFVFLLSILFFFLSSSFFIINEGERGIIIKFGKILRDEKNKTIVYAPGLHVKIPFLEIVKTLDGRIHSTYNQEEHFLTKDKKDLIIDSYVKWRVNDFNRYYNTTGGDLFQSETLLKIQLNDRLRSEINQYNTKEIITDNDDKIVKNVSFILNNQPADVKQSSLINDKRSISMLGIEIIDVRIKKISLPRAVSNAIYNRIRSEQNEIAKNQLLQGKEKFEKLRLEADYQASIVLSQAQKKAFIIKGESEATVMQLFSKNFSKDPDFYFFVRSLRAYENSLKNQGNVMLISENNIFFQYIHKLIEIKD